MKVGYIRVSTQEQNTIRQEVLMQALGVEQVFIDRMSGKNLARPELQKLLAFVRTGDCVIVESISRFARNTRDLLELIERLQSKQVQFVSKKEAIDTTTPTGEIHADGVRRSSRAGTGIHSPAPERGHRHCERKRRL